MHRMTPHIHHLIHLQALGHLMRDKNHRHLALEAVDGLGEVFGGLLIQVGDGFVEDQHLGAFEQGASNGDALAPFFEELTGKSPEEEAEDEDAAYWAAFEGTDTEVEAEEDEFTGEDRYADLPIKFAIIGRPNVGKSTLTNRMLGEDRVIVFDLPGTTRDSIYIPLERDEQQYIVIDTAGVRKKKKIYETVEKFSVVKTLQAIEDANVVLLLIDAREGVSDQDLSLL
jgi:GTP-binding protein